MPLWVSQSKIVLGPLCPGKDPIKDSLFFARASYGSQDSTNSPQNIFFYGFWTYHPICEQILHGENSEELATTPSSQNIKRVVVMVCIMKSAVGGGDGGT